MTTLTSCIMILEARFEFWEKDAFTDLKAPFGVTGTLELFGLLKILLVFIEKVRRFFICLSSSYSSAF